MFVALLVWGLGSAQVALPTNGNITPQHSVCHSAQPLTKRKPPPKPPSPSNPPGPHGPPEPKPPTQPDPPPGPAPTPPPGTPSAL